MKVYIAGNLSMPGLASCFIVAGISQTPSPLSLTLELFSVWLSSQGCEHEELLEDVGQ